MPNPAYAEDFEWDEENEAELAQHRISTSEVEQVWGNEPLYTANKKHRAGDRKMIGCTNGGRVLTIVLRYDSRRRRIRAVTGWDATEGERSHLR